MCSGDTLPVSVVAARQTHDKQGIYRRRIGNTLARGCLDEFPHAFPVGGDFLFIAIHLLQIRLAIKFYFDNEYATTGTIADYIRAAILVCIFRPGQFRCQVCRAPGFSWTQI